MADTEGDGSGEILGMFAFNSTARSRQVWRITGPPRRVRRSQAVQTRFDFVAPLQNTTDFGLDTSRKFP